MIETLKGAGARAGLVTGVTTGFVMLGLVLAGAQAAADPVDDAFGDLQSKATTYGGATVALVVAVVVLFFGIKMLKRGASKA